MATRVITVDDLTGKETLTAKRYRLSLSQLNNEGKVTGKPVTAEFDLSIDSVKALSEWITTGDTRDLAGAIPRRTRVGGSDSNGETEAIRAWAKTQDEWKDVVKDRGRLPEGVADAYRAAHPTTAPTTDASSQS